MNGPQYRVLLAAGAERTLSRLSEGSAAAVVEFLAGALTDGPHQVGYPLGGELGGLRAVRRGPYRVIYEADHGRGVLSVLRIDHQADVYRL